MTTHPAKPHDAGPHARASFADRIAQGPLVVPDARVGALWAGLVVDAALDPALPGLARLLVPNLSKCHEGFRRNHARMR